MQGYFRIQTNIYFTSDKHEGAKKDLKTDVHIMQI